MNSLSEFVVSALCSNIFKIDSTTNGIYEILILHIKNVDVLKTIRLLNRCSYDVTENKSILQLLFVKSKLETLPINKTYINYIKLLKSRKYITNLLLTYENCKGYRMCYYANM